MGSHGEDVYKHYNDYVSSEFKEVDEGSRQPNYGMIAAREAQLNFDLGNLPDSQMLLDTHGPRENDWEFLNREQGTAHLNESHVTENSSLQSDTGLLLYSQDEVRKIMDESERGPFVSLSSCSIRADATQFSEANMRLLSSLQDEAGAFFPLSSCSLEADISDNVLIEQSDRRATCAMDMCTGSKTSTEFAPSTSDNRTLGTYEISETNLLMLDPFQHTNNIIKQSRIELENSSLQSCSPSSSGRVGQGSRSDVVPVDIKKSILFPVSNSEEHPFVITAANCENTSTIQSNAKMKHYSEREGYTETVNAIISNSMIVKGCGDRNSLTVSDVIFDDSVQEIHRSTCKPKLCSSFKTSDSIENVCECSVHKDSQSDFDVCPDICENDIKGFTEEAVDVTGPSCRKTGTKDSEGTLVCSVVDNDISVRVLHKEESSDPCSSKQCFESVNASNGDNVSQNMQYENDTSNVRLELSCNDSPVCLLHDTPEFSTKVCLEPGGNELCSYVDDKTDGRTDAVEHRRNSSVGLFNQSTELCQERHKDENCSIIDDQTPNEDMNIHDNPGGWENTEKTKIVIHNLDNCNPDDDLAAEFPMELCVEQCREEDCSVDDKKFNDEFNRDSNSEIVEDKEDPKTMTHSLADVNCIADVGLSINFPMQACQEQDKDLDVGHEKPNEELNRDVNCGGVEDNEDQSVIMNSLPENQSEHLMVACQEHGTNVNPGRLEDDEDQNIMVHSVYEANDITCEHLARGSPMKLCQEHSGNENCSISDDETHNVELNRDDNSGDQKIMTDSQPVVNDSAGEALVLEVHQLNSGKEISSAIIDEMPNEELTGDVNSGKAEENIMKSTEALPQSQITGMQHGLPELGKSSGEDHSVHCVQIVSEDASNAPSSVTKHYNPSTVLEALSSEVNATVEEKPTHFQLTEDVEKYSHLVKDGVSDDYFYIKSYASVSRPVDQMEKEKSFSTKPMDGSEIPDQYKSEITDDSKDISMDAAEIRYSYDAPGQESNENKPDSFATTSTEDQNNGSGLEDENTGMTPPLDNIAESPQVKHGQISHNTSNDSELISKKYIDLQNVGLGCHLEGDSNENNDAQGNYVDVVVSRMQTCSSLEESPQMYPKGSAPEAIKHDGCTDYPVCNDMSVIHQAPTEKVPITPKNVNCTDINSSVTQNYISISIPSCAIRNGSPPKYKDDVILAKDEVDLGRSSLCKVQESIDKDSDYIIHDSDDVDVILESEWSKAPDSLVGISDDISKENINDDSDVQMFDKEKLENTYQIQHSKTDSGPVLDNVSIVVADTVNENCGVSTVNAPIREYNSIKIAGAIDNENFTACQDGGKQDKHPKESPYNCNKDCTMTEEQQQEVDISVPIKPIDQDRVHNLEKPKVSMLAKCDFSAENVDIGVIPSIQNITDNGQFGNTGADGLLEKVSYNTEVVPRNVGAENENVCEVGAKNDNAEADFISQEQMANYIDVDSKKENAASEMFSNEYVAVENVAAIKTSLSERCNIEQDEGCNINDDMEFGNVGDAVECPAIERPEDYELLDANATDEKCEDASVEVKPLAEIQGEQTFSLPLGQAVIIEEPSVGTPDRDTVDLYSANQKNTITGVEGDGHKEEASYMNEKDENSQRLVNRTEQTLSSPSVQAEENICTANINAVGLHSESEENILTKMETKEGHSNSEDSKAYNDQSFIKGGEEICLSDTVALDRRERDQAEMCQVITLDTKNPAEMAQKNEIGLAKVGELPNEVSPGDSKISNYSDMDIHSNEENALPVTTDVIRDAGYDTKQDEACQEVTADTADPDDLAEKNGNVPISIANVAKDAGTDREQDEACEEITAEPIREQGESYQEVIVDTIAEADREQDEACEEVTVDPVITASMSDKKTQSCLEVCLLVDAQNGVSLSDSIRSSSKMDIQLDEADKELHLPLEKSPVRQSENIEESPVCPAQKTLGDDLQIQMHEESNNGASEASLMHLESSSMSSESSAIVGGQARKESPVSNEDGSGCPPNLESSPKNSPFTDVQQAQLRSQILVYGSIIQGAAPDERYMVTAFLSSDGVSGESESRAMWEKSWQAAVERIRSKGSRVAAIASRSRRHETESNILNEPHKILDVRGSSSLVSDTQKEKESSLDDSSQDVEIVPDVVLDRPRKRSKVLTDVSDLSFGEQLSEAPSQVNDFNSETGLQIAGPIYENDLRNDDSTHTPESLALVVCENQVIGPSTEHAPGSSADIASSPSSYGDWINKANDFQSLIRELEKAKASADEASSKAKLTVTESESVWSHIKSLNLSGQISDAEKRLVSSSIVMTTAASVARAAAAAAKVAYEAALFAKRMREGDVPTSDQLNGQEPVKCLEYKSEADASQDDEANMNSSSISTAHAQTISALRDAAGLASDAISQVGIVMKMGNIFPFTLETLVKNGPEHVRHLLSCNPKMPMHNDGRKETILLPQSFSEDTEKELYVEEPENKDDGVVTLSEDQIPKDTQGDEDVSLDIQIAIPNGHVVSPTLSNLVKGSLVEVRSDEDGLNGVWFSGKVQTIEGHKVLVVYDQLLSDDGIKPLEEWVVMETSSPSMAPKLRLAHPVQNVDFEGIKKRRRSAFSGHSYFIGDRVDAWISDGWWEGEIMDIYEDDDNVKVFFPGDGDTQVIRISNLRPALVWDQNEWVLWKDINDERETICDIKFRKKSDTPAAKRQKVEKLQVIHTNLMNQRGSPTERTQSEADSGDSISNKSDSHRAQGPRVLGVPKSSKKRKLVEVTKQDISNNGLKSANFKKLEDRGTAGAVDSRRYSSESSKSDGLPGKKLLYNNPKVKTEKAEGSLFLAQTKSSAARFQKEKSVQSSTQIPTRKDTFGRDYSGTRSINVNLIGKKVASVAKLQGGSDCKEEPKLKDRLPVNPAFRGAESRIPINRAKRELSQSRSRIPLPSSDGSDRKYPGSGPAQRVAVDKNEAQPESHHNTSVDASELRRTSRKIKPTSKLLEGLQTAPIIRTTSLNANRATHKMSHLKAPSPHK